MSSTSLLDWILSLLRDPEARAAFQEDPEGYASAHGFQDLTPADVHDALLLIADSQSAGYDHHHHGGHAVHVHLPPPPPPTHHHGDGATYLNTYVTNNYTVINEHETNIDNSVHQHIDTDGGDFSQVIDNDPVVASGDGAVAAGDDIEDSTITTGDGNVVGDNNQAVIGDDNTTAFGSGDATSANFDDVRVDDGGSLAVGGDSSGYSSDDDTTTSIYNRGDGDTAVNVAGDHSYAGQAADQSYEDSSSHSYYEDNSTTDSHDDIASHNSASYDDSNDVEVHHA